MLRGVFVTGTDTGVGKTVASAALMARYRRAEGPTSLRYWKPIQTGIEEDDDTATVRQLSGAPDEGLLDAGVRLPRPLSPHLAARLNGERIDIRALLAMADAQAASDRWIVEGAGGVLVPIDETTLMIDLMVHLALPVVVVARSSLGTINHTLLTLEALRRRGLLVAGAIMAGPPNLDNRQAVEAYGSVRVLGELPVLDPLTSEALADWARSALDPVGHLAEDLT